MTVGPKKTRFIFDRGNRVWLLLFLLCLQVRTFPVSLWSVSEVSYFSATADIHMSHFSNFTLFTALVEEPRNTCCQRQPPHQKWIRRHSAPLGTEASHSNIPSRIRTHNRLIKRNRRDRHNNKLAKL